MKYVWGGAIAAALASTSAYAGGIDRSGQGVNILFEEGDYAQLTFSTVNPNIDGAGAGLGWDGDDSTDVGPSYTQVGLGYKHQFSEQLSAALIYDQPFGAHVLYEDGPLSAFGSAGLPYNGTADVSSHAFTGLLQYDFGGGFSVHGGFRALHVEGLIQTGGGVLDAESDYDFGGVIGVAYEIPDIALRVALTYSSSIDASFEGTYQTPTEAFIGAEGITTTFDVELPESVNLDFQTGIAQNTLLFGSVRWVAWEGVELSAAGVDWVDWDEDTITYSLGIGHRINDKWSVAATLGYEAAGDRPSDTALAPTTGSRSIGLGATYQATENLKISGGIQYVQPGDQTFVAVEDIAEIEFESADALAIGLRIGVQF